MRRDFGRGGASLETRLESMMTQGRAIPGLPDVVRARALARARVVVASAANVTRGEPALATHRRGLWIALAASLALVLGAAGATAALRGWPSTHREPAPASNVGPAIPSAAAKPVARSQSPEGASQATLETKPQPVAGASSGTESYAAELRLLQRAQASYTRENFSGALGLVAEHGRRFPKGRLAEQREALRVRSLSGWGRADEAQRAFSAFAARFPRSVLLQSLRATTRPPE
jgi:hypothetical protein